MISITLSILLIAKILLNPFSYSTGTDGYSSYSYFYPVALSMEFWVGIILIRGASDEIEAYLLIANCCLSFVDFLLNLFFKVLGE